MNWHMDHYIVKKQTHVKNTMINSIIDDNGNIIDKKIEEDVNRKVEWIYIHEKLYFARRKVKRLKLNAILKVDTERPKNDGRESKWKLLRCKGRIHFERRSATTWMTRICPRRFMNGSHISDHHEIILDGSSSEGFDFYGRGVC